MLQNRCHFASYASGTTWGVTDATVTCPDPENCCEDMALSLPLGLAGVHEAVRRSLGMKSCKSFRDDMFMSSVMNSGKTSVFGPYEPRKVEKKNQPNLLMIEILLVSIQ